MEAKATAITKAQAQADQRNKEQLDHIRRVGNERFMRWLDNARWTLKVFLNESRFLVWLILLNWIVSGAAFYFAARYTLSDRCLKQTQCRAIAIQLWKE